MKQKLNLLPEKKMRKNEIKDWFMKWDRTIAAITGVIVFLIVFTVVLFNIEVLEDDATTKSPISYFNFFDVVNFEVSDDGKSPISKPNIYEAMSSKKCQLDSSGLICSNVTSEKLCDEIYLGSFNKTESVKSLTLSNVQFPDNQMKKGWLPCSKLSITTMDLSISEVQVQNGAFSGTPFANLEYLILQVNKVNFTKEIFEDAGEISTLEIRCENVLKSGVTFAENAFAALANSLQTLQISQCITQETGDKLTAITGSDKLTALISLDLQDNDLNVITKTSFQSVPNLQVLYLARCKINEIQLGAFAYPLQKLDLSSNSFATLPKGLFYNSISGISLANDVFLCSCDLIWMKNFFDDHPEKFCRDCEKTFYCNADPEPPLPYTEVSFCQENVTTSTDYTTSTFPTTALGTTANGEEAQTNMVSIPCNPPQIIPIDAIENMKTLQVRDSTVKITLVFVNGTYALQFEGNLSEEVVLWFNSDNKANRGCLQNNNFRLFAHLGPLVKNSTYIFCLINSSQSTVNPLDCAAAKIPLDAEPSDEILISSKYMVPFVCGCVGALLLAIVLSGLAVFYCIRQHPRLIKGNKRVIIVGRESTDAIVLPRYYDEISYRPPSLNSYSNGYLTPKYKIYASPRPNSRLRTISENMVYVGPSAKDGNKKRAMGHVQEEHIYEPPPLPPNHPSEIDNLGAGRVYVKV